MIDRIARTVHEAHRAVCIAFDDTSRVPWEQASDADRASTVAAVRMGRENPNSTPRDEHERWCAEKREAGWKYGPVRNNATKEHPSLVDYDALPIADRAKTEVIHAVIIASLVPFAAASPPVAHVLQFFACSHLPQNLQDVSQPFSDLAQSVAAGPSNAETTVALRKLLEAKDAAVRAVLSK